ncbi:hypothetical protein Bbelb_152650 [Branchiostoma belcheri]|nr:hypothetical protein Bbelb_152650 [Branchiostoma belcheri]
MLTTARRPLVEEVLDSADKSDIPEDTEYYKGDEKAMGIGKKEDSILEDAQEADVVFSLGNKIFDHFENQFRAISPSKRPQHVKFVPRPSKIFEDAQAEYKDTETMVVLSIGRVKGAEKLKGYDLTAEFLSIVADKMKIRWRAMGVNKDDFEATKEILEHYKSANLQITLLPYGTQKDICKEMMQAHLVLMPSRAEPFGLVGMEAIAAGVPVLVSSNSGLADFIHEHVDELHYSIVDMDGSDEGVTVRRWADAIERVLKHNRAEFKTAARGKRQLLSSKCWEESHMQFIQACTDAGSTMSCPPGGQDDKIAESRETGMEEASNQEGTVLYEMTPQPTGGPPLLPVVVEILEQVLPSVETPDDMLNYVSAIETLSTITVDKPLHRTMLEQIKSRTSSITDLLTVVKAVEKLERFKGIKVSCVKTGSLVFHLQCTDTDGLGELWFMYQRGELDNLLHSSLISGETLRQLHAKSVSVKSTINIEDFRKALIYILNSTARDQPIPRLPLEYPLHQPHTHTTSRLLDVLHLDQKKLPQMPLPTQRDDVEDDVSKKLGNLQIADDHQAMEAIGDTEVPQMMSELVSLDIKELERLMGPRRKRTSSIGSDSSGYVTGTPGSGLSRPDSLTGEGGLQGTLGNLLAELNTPAVQRDKVQQFDLYCQIGDLYRTKLQNSQSALQYYQNMLECSQALSEETKQAKAYSRLGLTCDMLGLQAEAFTNHEKALAIYRVEAGNETNICVAYKNLASSLALSGQVSDAKTNYESALAVAMETGNKIEQMDIYCKLGDLHRIELHEPQESLQYYTEMLALARELGRKGKMLAYNRLGNTYLKMQDEEEALKWHQKHLEMSQRDEDKEDQITAHTNVGTIYRLLSKLDLATFHLNTALQLAQQVGDRHKQMNIYLKTGDMHGEQLHAPRTAIQYYKQTLVLARQLKDRHHEGLAYNRLGRMHSEMGKYGAAMEWCQKYLKIIEEDGNKEELITAHSNVGHVCGLLGKLDQSTSHFNTALQLAQQTGNQHEQMKVCFEIGEMQREQLHAPRTAIQYYEQALSLARQLKDRDGEKLAYNRLGQVHYEMGEFGAALEWSQKYLQISREDGSKGGQIGAHTNLGTVHRLQGNLDQATSHFNTALQLAQQTEIQYGQMEVYFQMGEMHREQLHSPHTAIQYYEQALALAKQLKDRDKEGLAYKRLEMAHYDMGEHEVTLEFFKKALKIQGDKGTQGKTHTNVDRASELQYPERSVTSQNAEDERIHNMKISFYIGEMQRDQAHSPRTAIHYYKQHLALARQLKDRHEEGLAYDRLGRAHFELEEYEIALDLYQRLLKMRKEDRDKKAQITAHKNIAKSYKKLGKKGQAKSQYQSAITIAMETGDKQQQDDIRKKISKL